MRKLSFSARGRIFSFLCVLPWVLGLCLFTLSPIGEVISYSFCRNVFNPDGTVEKTFIGLTNYQNAFVKEGYFRVAALSYAQQIFLMGPMIIVFSLLIALALNKGFRGRTFYRAVFFFPVVLMQGPFLSILDGLGSMEIKGLESFFVFRFLVTNLPEAVYSPIMYIMQNVVYIVWMSGVQQLVFLSGLQKVDGNMYEAAAVDGASAWQSFWKITLPVLRPFILLCGVYTVVDLSMSPLNPIIGLIKQFMFSKANGFGYSGAIAVMYLALIVLSVGIYAAVIMLWGKRPRREQQ